MEWDSPGRQGAGRHPSDHPPLGDVATLDLLVAGNVLGEMALLAPGGTRSATAVALEPTETHRVDAATFAELRREHPSSPRCLSRSWRPRFAS